MDISTEGFEPESVEGAPQSASQRMPVLIIALGRGRVGKTAILNTIVQFYRARGARVEVWNVDPHNQSGGLSAVIKDARLPMSAGGDDGKIWLEEQMVDQVQRQYDVVLDVGGNDTQIRDLASEIDLVKTLERRGIRPVAIHMIGTDKADLDYLRTIAEADLFMPAATLIVPNSGLLRSSRSSNAAFAEIKSEPVVFEVLKRGGKVCLMPRLPCMMKVIDRKLTFEDAANGVKAEGHEPLSFFDQERVSRWLTKEMTEFFQKIPPLWMPALPDGESL